MYWRETVTRLLKRVVPPLFECDAFAGPGVAELSDGVYCLRSVVPQCGSTERGYGFVSRVQVGACLRKHLDHMHARIACRGGVVQRCSAIVTLELRAALRGRGQVGIASQFLQQLHRACTAALFKNPRLPPPRPRGDDGRISSGNFRTRVSWAETRTSKDKHSCGLHCVYASNVCATQCEWCVPDRPYLAATHSGVAP